MMCKFICEKPRKVSQRIVFLLAVLLFLCSAGSYAYGKSSRNIVIYKNLYDYGKYESNVLKIYCCLKSEGKDVLLLQASSIGSSKIEQGDTLVIIPSSFDSESEYKHITDTYSNNEAILYGEENIPDEKPNENAGPFIEICKIYPFSDLNKLMDMSDVLHSKGISPVFTIMPVYDNYTLEAYDKYIEVLRYIGKNGGCFFIHEPVSNKDGTYNMDPKPLFTTAIEEYRKRGVEIVGVRISMDRLFSNYGLYQGLGLPFIIVTEQEAKVDSSLDLYKISETVNNHILIMSSKIDAINTITYKSEAGYLSEYSISLDINKDAEKLDYLIAALRSEKIPVRDFNPKSFDYRFEEDDGTVTKEEGAKTQLDKFKEQEMEKIKGSNLEEEKQGEQGYDISSIIATGIKISLVMIGLLLIYMFIGRRLDIRKIFKL